MPKSKSSSRKKSKPTHKPSKPVKPAKPVKSAKTISGAAAGDPVFAQPMPSPDPTSFRDPVTDQNDQEINAVSPVPQPTGNAVEPVITLAQVYGSQGNTITTTITNAGQIVFHSVGDTGSPSGPTTQNLVSDKMVADFDEANAADEPSFFYHLGDVVYYFGESTYYYDQFYDPFRSYPAPIVAIPGNHDGVVWSGDPAPTLQGFLENFCTPAAAPAPDAGGLLRTTMTQPGVYFTFEAPFVRILGVYSNVLEDPGVISDQNGTYPTLDQRQVAFLTAALERVKTDSFTGAVIIAVHHPPFTGGSDHGGSPDMLADIDTACTAAGVWPHAVFSGHSHNYQRYTRTVNGLSISYLVAGCGGHSPLSKMSGTYRTPYTIDSTLTLESYDDTDFGYLRVVVTATTMTIEFHPQHDGGTTKTPDDTVTIDLQTYAVS